MHAYLPHPSPTAGMCAPVFRVILHSCKNRLDVTVNRISIYIHLCVYDVVYVIYNHTTIFFVPENILLRLTLILSYNHCSTSTTWHLPIRMQFLLCLLHYWQLYDYHAVLSGWLPNDFKRCNRRISDIPQSERRFTIKVVKRKFLFPLVSTDIQCLLGIIHIRMTYHSSRCGTLH